MCIADALVGLFTIALVNVNSQNWATALQALHTKINKSSVVMSHDIPP